MLICIIVIVAFAACALGYAFFEMRMEQSETQSGQEEISGNASGNGGPEQWQAEGAPFIDVELSDNRIPIPDHRFLWNR